MADADNTQEGDREAGGAAVAPILARIFAEQGVHGRLLKTILELLTATRDDDGPSLSKLLENLVLAITNQTRALSDLSMTVAKFGRELPLDLVTAIDDNLDIPRRTQGGSTNGSTPS